MASAGKRDPDLSAVLTMRHEELLVSTWATGLAAVLAAGGCTKQPGNDSLSVCPWVDAELGRIEAMAPKKGYVDDRHAKAILGIGKKAAPCLVEKIGDTAPTMWAYSFQYTVGDMALALLDEMYSSAVLADPEDSSIDLAKQFPNSAMPYREFRESPGAMQRVRLHWQAYIKKH